MKKAKTHKPTTPAATRKVHNSEAKGKGVKGKKSTLTSKPTGNATPARVCKPVGSETKVSKAGNSSAACAPLSPTPPSPPTPPPINIEDIPSTSTGINRFGLNLNNLAIRNRFVAPRKAVSKNFEAGNDDDEREEKEDGEEAASDLLAVDGEDGGENSDKNDDEAQNGGNNDEDDESDTEKWRRNNMLKTKKLPKLQLTRKPKALIERQKELREATDDPAEHRSMDYNDIILAEVKRCLQRLFTEMTRGRTGLQDSFADFQERQATMMKNIDLTTFTAKEKKDTGKELNIPFKTLRGLMRGVVYDTERLTKFIFSTWPADMKDWISFVMRGVVSKSLARSIVFTGPNSQDHTAIVFRMGRTCNKLPKPASAFFHSLVFNNKHCKNKRLEARKIRTFFQHENKKFREEETARMIKLAILNDDTPAAKVATILICDDLLSFHCGIREARPDLDNEADCRNWLQRHREKSFAIIATELEMDSVADLTNRALISKCTARTTTQSLKKILQNAENLEKRDGNAFNNLTVDDEDMGVDEEVEDNDDQNDEGGDEEEDDDGEVEEGEDKEEESYDDDDEF